MDPEKLQTRATVASRLAAGLARFHEMALALQADAVEMATIAMSFADDTRQNDCWNPSYN
jgi:hypothetical protein